MEKDYGKVGEKSRDMRNGSSLIAPCLYPGFSTQDKHSVGLFPANTLDKGGE
jgi:hypothetical protein